MRMLLRLRPREFYDLVIQVAIVRPGPVQGGMMHPYLRRRRGVEPACINTPFTACMSRYREDGNVCLVRCTQTSPVGARCRRADGRIEHPGSFRFMHYLRTRVARIGWLRSRISMLTIGAPQCRDAKIGAAPCGDTLSPASTMAGACSSARIVARFCGRTDWPAGDSADVVEPAR
jgi:hypothetical protein